MSSAMVDGLDNNAYDEEDMNIEPDEEERSEEEDINQDIETEPMPTIQLSFDNSRGGAWDDRELVNAYDAAMEEFHVSGSFK